MAATKNEDTTDSNTTGDENTGQKGQTTVATRRGYRFVPSKKSPKVVTHDGVQVTATEADALVKESKGLVYIVDKEGK